MFAEGKSANPRGRPVGSKNKFSSIREDWLKAYHLGGGHKLWLRLQKEDFPLYMKLGTQMLPKEIEADIHGKIEVSWIGEDNNSV